MQSLDLINDFMSQRRLAMIGVSRDPKHYSRMLFRAMTERGYEIVPVNPGIDEVDGHRCFARVQDVDPQVYGAMVLTAEGVTDLVVRDCAESGVRRIWMRRHHKTAEEFCRRQGLDVIAGECPLMFLDKVEWPHRLHGWVRHLAGTYPGR